VDVGTLQGSFVIEERPDHLEEAVLIAMDALILGNDNDQNGVPRNWPKVELDLDALGASDSQIQSPYPLRLGLFDLHRQSNRPQA